jgi:hypothetical protein
MLNFTHILSGLQAAIAVVSARERALTALLVAVWGRIERIRTKLERLIALWRAGMLPKPRAPRAGRKGTTTGEKPVPVFPAAPAWLVAAVREAEPCGAQLEAMLSQEECVRFLAEVPQARRLLGGLCKMLGVGAHRARKPRVVWQVPRATPVMGTPAGLVLGPGGRLVWA